MNNNYNSDSTVVTKINILCYFIFTFFHGENHFHVIVLFSLIDNEYTLPLYVTIRYRSKV